MEISSKLKKLAAGLMAAATLESGELKADELPKPGTEATVAVQEKEEKKVETMRETATRVREYLRPDLVRVIAESGVNDVNLDHALLAFSDTAIIGDKSLIDLGAGPYISKEEQVFTPSFNGSQQRHVGAVVYSFLRTGIPMEKRVQVKGGKPITVKELVKIDAEEVGKGYSNDYEWGLLTMIELKKRGIDYKLVDRKGRQLTMAELVQLNRAELDFKHAPEKLAPEVKKKFDEAGGGTCESSHALHSLEAYAVFTKDSQKTDEFTKFTFEKIADILKKEYPKGNIYAVQHKLHHLGHLLTVLTELPPDYALDKQQRETLRQAVKAVQEGTLEYKKLHDALPEKEKRFEKLDSGALSHIVDALEHLPPSLLEDQKESSPAVDSK